MASFLVGASLAVAVACAIWLVVFVMAATGARPSFEKTGAVALLLSIAVLQAFLSAPGLGKFAAYILLPVAATAVVYAFIRTVKDAVGLSPSDGPNFKIPAVAKPVPHEIATLDERQVRKRVA